MFFQLLRQRCKEIDSLDVEESVPGFCQELASARPEIWGALESQPRGDALLATAARAYLGMIAEVPAMVRKMRKKMVCSSTAIKPLERDTLAAVLAYLIKPRDLISSSAGGGYGYLADCLLVRTALWQSMHELPEVGPAYAENGRDWDFISAAVSPACIAKLQTALEGLSTLCQLFRALPYNLLEETTQQMLEHPLEAQPPKWPKGFVPVARYARPHLALHIELAEDPAGMEHPGRVTMTLAGGGIAMAKDTIFLY